ncbi:MAG: hypothetical protein ABJD11_11955 [Gemmatimonadota bacterium]
MFGILLDELGFLIAAIAALGLAGYVVYRYTPLGLRLKQAENRKQIEARLELTCPIHGLQREDTLVRLKSGEALCSHCFKEAVDDVHVDES